MIKFKEQDGMLFEMLDKPVPLTADAEMPCIIAFIQDDSPMGRYVKQCWGHDEAFMREYTICSINADMAAKVGFPKDTPLSIHMLEIIGTPVKEGSSEWAWYQMMQGKKVFRVEWGCDMYCQYTNNEIITLRYGISSTINTVEEWIANAKRADFGWQIYKEPEPQHAKEPMADCENCKHVCTNSNIDHCHMYEPKPESEYKVGDWVEFIDAGGRKSQGKYLSNVYKNAILVLDIACNMRCVVPTTKIIRKLSPSEVVIHVGCLSGTVDDLSYAEDGRFWLMGKATERCPVGMFALLYDEMLDAPTREIVESLLEELKEQEEAQE